MKPRRSVTALQLLCTLTAAAIAVWSAGCTLFRSYQAPSPPHAVHALPQKSAVARPRPPIHSVPVVLSKPAPPVPVVLSKPAPPVPVVLSKPAPLSSNLPPTRLNPPPPPAPLVTLGSGEDAKAQAQRLVDQAAGRIAHVDQAQLAGGAAFTYQQANTLIEAAQHAMATQDYPAASSLAEKASALTDQLPAPR